MYLLKEQENKILKEQSDEREVDELLGEEFENLQIAASVVETDFKH